ncbi:PAS domain-containing protein [Halorientalis halophila]|uniref:PAS domain-containing protein n=1 Tax=Halorientalis halophila TaxID=3108499 RepID=UPI003008D1FB
MTEGGDDVPSERRRQQAALYDLTTDDDVADGNFERAVRTITERAADLLSVSRVGVWLVDDDGDRLTRVDHYDSDADTHTSGGELAAAAYPRYFDALRSNRTIAAADARTDERTAELTDDYLEPEGVRSLLDATLRAEGDVVGVVCHEQVGSVRDWSDTDVQFAADVADVVHRALRNRRSARQRRRLEYRQSVLKAQQEAIPHGVLVVAPDGEIVSFNDRFRDLWDLPEEVLATGTGADVFEHVREQVRDPEAFTDQVVEIRESNAESDHSEIPLADGRVIEQYSTPVEGESGTAFGRLWLARDVTERERRQAELELKDRAMDEAPVGITISDPDRPDNPTIYENERFTELTGYDAAEIRGRNLRLLQGENTDPERVAELREAIAAERPVSVELRNYRKDGSEFWNRVSVAPVEEDGSVVNYVGFQQDVTQRKETTRQLRVLHRVLRHNLANQMSVIRGWAEYLTDVTDGETADRAAQIVDQSDRLIAITDKHRRIVRLLSERPAPTAMDLAPIVERVVESARADPTVDVALERPEAAEALAITAIETALAELLRNAVDSCGDDDAVSVAVTADAERVTVRVADTGEGMPEAERQIVTGTQSVEPLYHGLGMGLWLAYWIVALSKGSIDVVDNEPRGTVVTVRLPRPDGGTDGIGSRLDNP